MTWYHVKRAAPVNKGISQSKRLSNFIKNKRANGAVNIKTSALLPENSVPRVRILAHAIENNIMPRAMATFLSFQVLCPIRKAPRMLSHAHQYVSGDAIVTMVSKNVAMRTKRLGRYCRKRTERFIIQ